MKEITTRYFS